MDTPAFADRHALLDPEQRLAAFNLGDNEPCPPAIAMVGREELRQGGAGRRGQGPALAQPRGSRTVRGRAGAAADSSAGDEGQSFRHTTHNASVLLLFLFRRVTGESQWCDSQTVGFWEQEDGPAFGAAGPQQ